MPNRYSHANVLSRYETRGFISPPTQSVSPSSPTASLPVAEFQPPSQKTSDENNTPPLTAVPSLIDSPETTSNGSNVDDVPVKPLHSASSSVVTEIYAPQSPDSGPIRGAITPTEIKIPDAAPPPAPPIEEPEIQETQPPPTTSCYSTARDFSSFFACHVIPKHKNKSSRSRRQSNTIEKSSQPQDTSTTASSSKSSSTNHLLATAHHPPPPITTHHHTLSTSSSANHVATKMHTPSKTAPRKSYPRLRPTYSDDSLPSLNLSLEDIADEDAAPSSPNEDVVPWEYPEYSTPHPESYGLTPTSITDIDNNKGEEVHTEDGSRDSGYHTISPVSPTAPTFSSQNASCPPARLQKKPPPSSPPPASRPKRHYAIAPSPSPPSSPNLLPTASSPHLLPLSSKTQQAPFPLPRSESFDSVAPPPISRTPRQPPSSASSSRPTSIHHNTKAETDVGRKSPARAKTEEESSRPPSMSRAASNPHPHSHAFTTWLDRATGNPGVKRNEHATRSQERIRIRTRGRHRGS